MRRIALLLVAALALACVASGADARPRKKHRKRGHAVVHAKRLPGAIKGIQQGLRPLPPAPGGSPGTPGTPGAPGTSQPDPPPLPPAPPPPTGSGRSVQMTTDDADPDALRLTLSRTTVLAGSVKVTFNNAWAQDPHNLVLEGPGEPVVFDELPKGEVAARSVALTAGTWTVYCGLDGHRRRGMQAKLTVAAG